MNGLIKTSTWEKDVKTIAINYDMWNIVEDCENQNPRYLIKNVVIYRCKGRAYFPQ